MTLNNIPVELIEAVEATKMGLEKFIRYLQNISRGFCVILIAHNCFRFVAPVVLKNVEKIGLLDAARSVVVRFADIPPIFHEHLPERKKNKLSFSQVQLARDYIGIESTEDAHNAVQDVRILSKLVIILGVRESTKTSQNKECAIDS